MLAWAALLATAAPLDGGVVVRLDYDTHLFVPTEAVQAATRRDRDLDQWLDEAPAHWRLLPAALTEPARVERLVGTGCGTAIVAGAPAVDLARVGLGTHSDGEAWWVLPTGEPLIEQVRGKAALEPMPGCGFAHSWVVTHNATKAGSRFYGLLVAPRAAMVHTLESTMGTTRDVQDLRWARSLDAGVWASATSLGAGGAPWDALLASGDVWVVLPQGIVAAGELEQVTHPERSSESWWVDPDSGAWVWPAQPEPEPELAAAD